MKRDKRIRITICGNSRVICRCRFSFEEGGTHINTEKMKVLVVRPMEMPEVQEIDHTLSAMQELVGGTIQAVYPFDDPVALICNA